MDKSCTSRVVTSCPDFVQQSDLCIVVLRHEEDTLILESRNNMLDMIVFIPMQETAKDDIVPTEKTEKTELEP